MSVARATETKPATSEIRVPQIVRESTSRPTLSVPRRWARPGAARLWARSCLSGGYGDSTGARRAAARAASITTAPSGASRALAARLRTTHRRIRTGPVARVRGRRAAEAGSAISDPGIEPAIEEVDHQVAQEEADGDQEHHALDQGIVTGEDGVDHQPPDPRKREDVLGDDRPTDQPA